MKKAKLFFYMNIDKIKNILSIVAIILFILMLLGFLVFPEQLSQLADCSNSIKQGYFYVRWSFKYGCMRG